MHIHGEQCDFIQDGTDYFGHRKWYLCLHICTRLFYISLNLPFVFSSVSDYQSLCFCPYFCLSVCLSWWWYIYIYIYRESERERERERERESGRKRDRLSVGQSLSLSLSLFLSVYIYIYIYIYMYIYIISCS